MVEIYRTNVTDPAAADKLLQELAINFPGCIFNFDLNDCDHILRMQYEADCLPDINTFLINRGWHCELID